MALFQAVRDSRFRQARFIIENGGRVHMKNKNGENLLIAAIVGISDQKRRYRMIKWLLYLGVDISEADKRTGRDPLTWAVVKNYTDIVKYILREKEVDINLRNIDKYGRCALHYAALNNNETVIMLYTKLFKKYRMNMDIKDIYNITPYIIARRLGHIGCANILLHDGGAAATQLTENLFDAAHIWDGLIEDFSTNGEPHPMFRKLDTKYIKIPVIPSIVVSEDGDTVSWKSSRSEKSDQYPRKRNYHKHTKSLPGLNNYKTEKQDVHSTKAVFPAIYNNRLNNYFVIGGSRYNTSSMTEITEPTKSSPSYQTVMPSVFSLLSQQQSNNYLPSVKKPEPKKEIRPILTNSKINNKVVSLAALSKVTRFTVLLKKKSQKKKLMSLTQS